MPWKEYSLKFINGTLLRVFGVTVQRIKPQKRHCFDPGGILYEHRLRDIVLEFPLRRWRTTNQAIETGEPNILSKAVQLAARESDRDRRLLAVRSAFETYGRSSSFPNAARRMGLSDDEAPGMKGAPPWAVHYPWDTVDVDRRIRMINEVALEENLKLGARLDAYNGGALIAGRPMSREKMEIEVTRTVQLMESIEAKGYILPEICADPVRATILKDGDGAWRWMVRGGVHRVSVAHGLGLKAIPCTVVRVVYRCDVGCWPGVKKGVFTKRGALKVFDLTFHGKRHDAGMGRHV